MPYYGLLKFDLMHFLNPVQKTVKDHAIRLPLLCKCVWGLCRFDDKGM